jgi:hypothetical protein
MYKHASFVHLVKSVKFGHICRRFYSDIMAKAKFSNVWKKRHVHTQTSNGDASGGQKCANCGASNTVLWRQCKVSGLTVRLLLHSTLCNHGAHSKAIILTKLARSRSSGKWMKPCVVRRSPEHPCDTCR